MFLTVPTTTPETIQVSLSIDFNVLPLFLGVTMLILAFAILSIWTK